MSDINKLFHQSSYYFIGNILVVLAGIISFPIWTRFFTKAEYGMLSLISISVSFLVVFLKLGLPNAALRFYTEFKEKKKNCDMRAYYTTIFFGSLFSSGSITLIVYLILRIVLDGNSNTTISTMLPLLAVITFVFSMNSILTEFIRAEQRGKIYSVVQIAMRYGRLMMSVVLVFTFMGNLYGFFLGWAIADGLIFLILLSILMFSSKIQIEFFSVQFLKEAVRYGFPLIWFELSNMILNFGDRYMIQMYMNEQAVGVYSVGYNLADMAQSSMTMPLRLAIIPMYLSIWSRHGEEKTNLFLSKTLNYYFMVGVPLIIGMSWFGKEILIFLASAKYQEAHILIPYVILPLIIYGAFPIYGAGLYIQKKTVMMMNLTLLIGIANILLNIILIPLYGILGAAYATLISYLILACIIFVKSSKYHKIKIMIRPIIRYILLSVIIAALLSIYSAGSINGMIIKVLLGIILYSVSALLLDQDLRAKVFSIIRRAN